MATRIHLDSVAAAAVSPAFSAEWDVTTSANRLQCGAAGIVDNDLASGSTYSETSATLVDVLAHQYVTNDQIQVARTISGTFKGIIPGYETNAAADGFLQVIVKVVSADGATVRGVLYPGSPLTTTSTTLGAVNQEFNVSVTGMETRIVPETTVTPVAALVNDRIVIEVGWRACNVTTTSRGAFFRHGYQAELADQPFTAGISVTALGAADLNPWFEFSEDIFAAAPPPTSEFGTIGNGVITSTLTGTELNNVSGIVASQVHPGYLYAHGDAGSPAEVYMVNISSGIVEATLTLTGATNIDWEDISAYGGKIYVGDIGNNLGTRTDQAIYKFTEPAEIIDQSVATTKYPITISGTVTDCEALMIDPDTGDVYVYMKANANVSSSGLYKASVAATSLATGSPNVFTKVLNHSLHQVTAADWSPDGRYYVLTTNGSDPTFDTFGGIYVFNATTNLEVARKQGNKTTPIHPPEGICWSVDASYFYRTFDGGGVSSMPLYSHLIQYVDALGGPVVADAGVDQTNIEPLTTVTLTGHATGGDGGYIHTWTQTSGTTVTLSGVGATRTFTAPAAMTASTLVFQYGANDGSDSDVDSLSVGVKKQFNWYASGGFVPYHQKVATNTTGSDPLAQIPTISSTTFKSYLGIRIFPTYSGLTGGQLVIDPHYITDLGVTTITHKLLPNMDPDVITFMQTMGAAGVKSVITVGEPFTPYNPAQWTQMMGYIQNQLADCVRMVTGQNEVNHVRAGGAPPADWAQQATDHQQELWTRMGSVNAALVAAGHSAVLVGNPNLWSGNIGTHDADLQELAPLCKNYANAITYHLYPRGGHPTWNVDNFINQYKLAYGANRPIFCTEAGYFSAANYTGGAKNVTQHAHDIYLRKMWVEYALRGAFVSQFEFLDDPDPTNANREANFGMIETPAVNQATWVPKNTYNNFKTMLTTISGGTAGTVGCEITTTGNIQRLAVSHGGGTKLYLWRRDDIELNMVPISLTPVSVSVKSASGTQVVSITDDIAILNL